MAIENFESAKLEEVHICIGATGELHHTLTVISESDNPWVNHGVKALDINGDVATSILIDPAAEYRPLLVEGLPFKLHCSESGVEGRAQLRLKSEFTAVPYVLNLNLGHHRRTITEELAPPEFVSKGDQIIAKVAVHSYYLKTKTLEAVLVDWWLNGLKLDTVPTDDSGVSQISTPIDTVGPQILRSEVFNPYDGRTTTHDYSFIALSETPWKDAQWEINGVPTTAPFLLKRGESVKVKLIAPELKGRKIKLNSPNSNSMTYTALPMFGSEVLADAAEWTLTQADSISGLLYLIAETIGSPIKLEVQFFVMSDKLSDEVESLLFNNVAPVDDPLFWRDEEQTVTVAYKEGSPLKEYLLDMDGTPLSGVLPANLSVTSNGVQSWAVLSRINSGFIRLALKAEGMIEDFNVDCKVVSRSLADEVNIEIDGNPLNPADTWFFWGTPRVITLVLKPDSPMAGIPVTATCDIKSGLVQGNVVSAPLFGTKQTVYNWSVTGSTNRGIFEVHFIGDGMTIPIKLPLCSLVSSDLSHEGEARIGGSVVPIDGNIFYPGEAQTVTFVPNASSPIVGLPISLQCAIQSDPTLISVESVPDFGIEQVTYSWEVTAEGGGDFQLNLASRGMTTPLMLAPSKVLKDKVWDMLKFELNWHWEQDENKLHFLYTSRVSNSLKFQAKTPDLVGKHLRVMLRDGYIPNRARLRPILPQVIGELHGAEWHIELEPSVSLGRFSVLVLFEDLPNRPHELFFEIVEG